MTATAAGVGDERPELWALDPAVDFLNHGSFGACPRAVLAAQQALRAELERQPVRFFDRTLPPRLEAARGRLAEFLGADREGLVFVPNATTGVNAALASHPLHDGDEVLVTDLAYRACRNALDHVAAARGARVRVVAIPFPIAAPEVAVEAITSAASERTRLALVDHVTSRTGLVLPIEAIVTDLEARGVAVVVDGAHAPGMLPLALDQLGASYYTGNCHKWLCAPKGAAFLWAREDRRATLRPTVISHGATLSTRRRSRLHQEFDWTGTFDPTPWLCVPAAIDHLEAEAPGGWEGLRARNRSLALTGQALLSDALGIDPPAPPTMIGSIAAVPLPDAAGPPVADDAFDPLQDALLFDHAIEVPVGAYPAHPGRTLRISAQLYNRKQQYERLASLLPQVLGG